MKRNHVELTTEFLTEQMNHWVLFMPAMTVMGVAAKYTGRTIPDWGMWALVGLCPFLYFLMRTGLKRFWSFFAAHFVLLTIVALVPAPDNCSYIIRLVYAAACMMYSFLQRFGRDPLSRTVPFQPAFIVGVAAASFLFQHYQGTKEWDGFYFFPLIASLGLYYIVYYMDHYLEFLERNKDTAGSLPAMEMLRSGLGLALGYTAFAVLIMLFSTNMTWLEGLVDLLKRGLAALLRAFFSLFTAEGGGDTPPAEEAVLSSVGGMPALLEEEPFWLWKVLEAVLAVALCCGMLYGCIRLIIMLVRFLRERFSFGLRKKGFPAEDSSDLREKCLPKREKNVRGSFLPRFLSAEARIRRLYKRKLLSSGEALAKESGGLALLTARESGRKLRLEGFADVYERARYSDQRMTNADVKKMQDACGRQASPDRESLL